MGNYNSIGGITLRIRKQALGDRNIIGAKIEAVRKEKGLKQKDLLAKLEIRGIELDASGLSKLEGQIRCVTDKELLALSQELDVSVDWLLGNEKNKSL